MESARMEYTRPEEEIRFDLPMELVLHVVDALAPAQPGWILNPSDPAAQTLFAFSRVCRATRSVALTYLGRHCMCIDSGARLRRLLFHLPVPDSLPSPTLLQSVRSLHLSPFGSGLNDLPTAIWVRELLYHTCGTLERLVIDMPLRTLYPDQDHLNVRPTLRSGFVSLTRLTEFVSVRDELYLDTTAERHSPRAAERGKDPPVWTLWPRLRRLALYNVDTTDAFWCHVAAAPALEHLVLTRPDGLRKSSPDEPALAAQKFTRMCGGLRQQPLRVLLVDVDKSNIRWWSMPMQPRGWDKGWDKACPPGRVVRVKIVEDLVPGNINDYLQQVIPACQNWVKGHALAGTLWDLSGDAAPYGALV